MPDQNDIRQAILKYVELRGHGKTICPSEVSRALALEEDAWRALMPEVRSVASALAREGRLVITQKGRVVDGDQVRGPIRLGLPDGR